MASAEPPRSHIGRSGAIEGVTERRRVTPSDDAYIRAGARLPLVCEQAATLPLRSIRDKILSAIRADDRAEVFVWLQQAGARLDAGNERDQHQGAEVDDIRSLLRSFRSRIESQPLADLHGKAQEAAHGERPLLASGPAAGATSS